jgi:hypothetical protein
MGAKHRSWWQYIREHWLVVVTILVLVLVIVALIITGYRFDWTGFNGNNKSGKTLWDWLQLLIIPLALAAIALVFQLANGRTERQIAKERYQQDQQIALDKQRQDLLESYLDRMSELLLKEQLRSSAVDAEVRNVARVRTITVLTQLDARRIGYVFAFLREAGLKSTTSNDNVVILGGANFRSVNWSQADLGKANLSYAFLGYADLGYATLNNATLNDTNLSEADLSHANLTGAIVTEEQLAKAKSLEGVTMPDGSIHP